jgi:hypothetical protein
MAAKYACVGILVGFACLTIVSIVVRQDSDTPLQHRNGEMKSGAALSHRA